MICPCVPQDACGKVFSDEFRWESDGSCTARSAWPGVSLERTMPASSGASIYGSGLFVTSRTKAHYKYLQEERGE